MIIFTLLKITLGLGVLVLGAEVLIRGATKLASYLGMSPLVIGLTVVAFATSAPEITINLSSLASGHGDLALGNVIGSNISNILLILGLTALMTPLIISQKLIRIDVPIMIGLSFFLWFISFDGNLSRLEAGYLILGLILYVIFSLWVARREQLVVQEEYVQEFGSPKNHLSVGQSIRLLLAGIACLAFGAKFLVEGASELSRLVGLSEFIIGLTVVACGSGAPEIAVSILAARKKEYDIAVGNIIGSCIFNILFVLGVSIFVYPEQVVSTAALNFDIPIMIAAALACLPLFLNHARIGRWEGGLLLFYYLAYLAFIVLDATDHDAVGPFSWLMFSFVIPITCIAVLMTLWKFYRNKSLN